MDLLWSMLSPLRRRPSRLPARSPMPCANRTWGREDLSASTIKNSLWEIQAYLKDLTPGSIYCLCHHQWLCVRENNKRNRALVEQYILMFYHTSTVRLLRFYILCHSLSVLLVKNNHYGTLSLISYDCSPILSVIQHYVWFL